MNGYALAAHDDDDSYAQRYYSPQTRTVRRPWSPEPREPDDYGYAGDGGAIARYLELQQERGGHHSGAAEAGPSGSQWPPSDSDKRWGGAHGRERVTGGMGRERRQRRQEASDVSVEALDLADYTTATFIQRPKPRYPSPKRSSPSPSAAGQQVAGNDYTRYPQYATTSSNSHRNLPIALNVNIDDQPSVDRPFSALSIKTRSSMGPPPSLTSARERLSSPSSQHSHSSRTPLRSTMRSTLSPPTTGRSRHMSLPPVGGPRAGEIAHFPSQSPHDLSFNRPSNPNAVDVQSFPKWSRGWYDSNTKQRLGGGEPASFPEPEADLGIWPPQAAPSYPFNSNTRSSGLGSAHRPSGSPRTPLGDSPLPWGRSLAGHGPEASEPPQYVSESVREERMRMLEQEFGTGTGTGKGKGKESPVGGAMIGSVHPDDGALITDGPKRRAAVRVMQCLLACIAGATGLYGAIAIHPNPPAPPASKPPAYALYILSVVTFLLTFYLYAIQPCVRHGKRKEAGKYSGGMGGPGGMMVLPVLGGMNGQKGVGGKKKGKAKHGANDSVQVNLIVDPTMFGGGTGTGRRHQDDDEEEEDVDMEGSRPRPSRRNVFEAMALEGDWKAARSRLKWQLAVDILFLLLWGAAFFFVIWGKRCPPGEFNGWCHTYNAATACACLDAFAFAFGIFYDIKDLSASKLSPRTRT